MKRIAALLPLVMLQGCAYLQNGSLEYADNPPDLNFLPTGIPYILGGFGTGVPVTDTVSLTAAHVVKWDYSTVIAKHPHCDIALIKANNKNKEKLKLGSVEKGDEVTVYGYGLTFGKIEGHGTYVLDEKFRNCTNSLNTAPVKSGMSGGAFVNKDNELVGITTRIGFYMPYNYETEDYMQLDRYTYFVPITAIEDWLFEKVPELDPSKNGVEK